MPLPTIGPNNEQHRAHWLSQRLNNRASYLMVARRYDEGIELLSKALRLTERGDATNRSRRKCQCEYCNLESCLSMEQDEVFSITESERQNDPNFRRKVQRNVKSEHNDDYDSVKKYEHNLDVENQDGFVYSRPLLVHTKSIEEGHYMGYTLSTIILFNLALAHHIMATSMVPLHSETAAVASSSRFDQELILKKALQLYEFAHQLHLDCDNQRKSGSECIREVGSLRFTIIISNNLGEIHRVAGNLTEHKMCLQHLLSSIMYMVDCNLISLNSSDMNGFYDNLKPLMHSNVSAKAA